VISRFAEPDDPRATTDADDLELIGVHGDLDPAPFARIASRRRSMTAAATPRRAARWAVVRRIVIGLLALWVFLVALALMRDGARGLAPALGAAVSSIPNAVGFGWLGALLVLSGSPVAATSLALLDAGALSVDETYGMIVGSRLGAAFVVLVVGALYAMRGRSVGRRAPISIGVLALAMTAIVYVPGGFIGLGMLQSGWLSGVTLTPPPIFYDGTRALTEPPVSLIESILDPSQMVPASLLFLIGVGLLLLAFRLVDELLPSLERAGVNERARWYVGPWTMFAIGLVAALATLSVAVALSILVPAVAKGYLRREQTLPYIMGANITTLVDTLLVGVLTGNDDAPRVVIAVGLAVSIVSVLLLAVAYRPLRRATFALQSAVVASPMRLGAFVAVLFLVPIGLLVVR
jgi:Na+/phosphate symporter